MRVLTILFIIIFIVALGGLAYYHYTSNAAIQNHMNSWEMPQVELPRVQTPPETIKSPWYEEYSTFTPTPKKNLSDSEVIAEVNKKWAEEKKQREDREKQDRIDHFSHKLRLLGQKDKYRSNNPQLKYKSWKHDLDDMPAPKR